MDARYGEDLWRARLAIAVADVAKKAPDGSPLRDSPVGDLNTDALRAKGGTDVALTVDGFLTEGLTRGALVRDDAFRIVGDGIDPTGAGLGFPLFEIRLTGVNLLAALETSLAAGADFSGIAATLPTRLQAVGNVKNELLLLSNKTGPRACSTSLSDASARCSSSTKRPIEPACRVRPDQPSRGGAQAAITGAARSRVPGASARKGLVRGVVVDGKTLLSTWHRATVETVAPTE